MGRIWHGFRSNGTRSQNDSQQVKDSISVFYRVQYHPELGYSARAVELFLKRNKAGK
jgi:hypothetical protein